MRRSSKISLWKLIRVHRLIGRAVTSNDLVICNHFENVFEITGIMQLLLSYHNHLLFWFAYISVLETTIKLVDAGACINILNKDGHTPLYYLIEKQDISTINQVLPYLLTKEADPSLGADLPLITAANLNQTTTLNMLLEHGIDVDKKNSRGNTALTTILDTYSGGQKVVAYTI